MQILEEEVRSLLEEKEFPQEISRQFLQRAMEGNLSIEENPTSHFCVYFAAFDPIAKEAFIGHHKKSGLWLFNGGHIEKGETIRRAVKREIKEEWDLEGDEFKIENPQLLTITEIDNPKKQTCRRHYDLWCFVEVDKKVFNPSKEALREEFYEYGWKSFKESRRLIDAENNLKAVDFIENSLCKKCC